MSFISVNWLFALCILNLLTVGVNPQDFSLSSESTILRCKKCAEIQSNEKRLECYDNIFRSDSIPQSSVSQPTGRGEWEIQVTTDNFSDKSTTYAILRPKEFDLMKKDWYLLSIYCIDTIPIIAIYWNCLVSSNAHDVSYRLDNDTIIKAQCVGLGDGKTSAFSLRSDSLLQKLKSASMLRLAVVTTLEGRKTLTFDIRGFEQTVTALSSDCFD